MPTRGLSVLAVAAALALVASSSAYAAATGWVGDARVAVRLIAGSGTADGKPTVDAGLQFRYASGWHGYWRTPGDAGLPPTFDWSASQNIKPPSVAWPAPTRLVVDGLQNSIYAGTFTLPVSTGRDDPASPARIAVTIDYAACANICVPEHAELSLDVPAGAGAPSAEDELIATARQAVPGSPAAAGIDVLRTAIVPAGDRTSLVVDLGSRSGPFTHPDLFVEGAGDGLPPAPSVQLADGGRAATLTVSLPERRAPFAPLTVTIVDKDRSAEFATSTAPPPAPARRGGLIAVLVSALLGGLILNLMPCVLPILSLKLLGVARHAGQGRRAVRLGFAATAAGIVASFLLLAAALVGLKLCGATLGWGIQFQQPWFLAGMAALTVLFAASFFEWLPIGMPGVLGRLGGSGTKPALVEAFLAGAVSTLLATPCSAPFVGTAVGFALAGGSVDIVAVFLCLGLGMAAPFLGTALFPGLVAWLPRPGPWMLRLRQVLGVLLLGTAAWLLVVLWSIAGGLVAAVVALLLATTIGFRAWIAGDARTEAKAWPKLVTAGFVVAAIIAAELPALGRVAQTGSPADWQAFDPEKLDGLVARGQTVLVDVTAAWCLTCKVNELTALDTAAVRARLAEPGTVRMRADWSRPNPAIAAYLHRFSRYGIPLDVVYGPRRPSGDALPELLTSDTVLTALDRASSGRASGSAGL